jgi:hypothetical protein
MPTENRIVSGISKYAVFCFGDTQANEYYGSIVGLIEITIYSIHKSKRDFVIICQYKLYYGIIQVMIKVVLFVNCD